MANRADRQRRVLKSLRKHTQIHVDAIHQFQISVLLLVGLLFVGTAGYMWLEAMEWDDALYMTVITLTTVGFGEVEPLSSDGRLFTIVLILLGVSLSAYAIRNAAEIVLGDNLWVSLGEREMSRLLEQIRDHYIVCGYGRMGREIINEFQRHGQPCVVVDADESIHEELIDRHIPHVVGDATLDEVLLEAGIARARGLLAVVDSDADNVLIVLSAKGLNPSLKVVSRAATEEIESKLRRAGADSVTSPYIIGGQRMAFAMMRPAVHDFLNTVVYSEEEHSEMGQLRVRQGSPLAGRTLRQSELRSRWGAVVVGIIERDGRIIISPDANRKLVAGETLIVVAPTDRLRHLEDGSGWFD